ncbi:MAG: hypothetical protein L6Q37_16095 [Bdellovibrionaceae bacterium]|nr:hypothetical protein [Pseudobdellovibrionaceae bacterium]
MNNEKCKELSVKKYGIEFYLGEIHYAEGDLKPFSTRILKKFLNEKFKHYYSINIPNLINWNVELCVYNDLTGARKALFEFMTSLFFPFPPAQTLFPYMTTINYSIIFKLRKGKELVKIYNYHVEEKFLMNILLLPFSWITFLSGGVESLFGSSVDKFFIDLERDKFL